MIQIVFHHRLIFVQFTFLFNQLKLMVCSIFFLIHSLKWKIIFVELLAGKLTRLLVGTRNKGSQNFVIESIDGSLRYPQDYNYYIQNFTSLRSEKILEPGLESTFEYLFMPSETFNGRPMGLVILLNYRNAVSIFEWIDSILISLSLFFFRKENIFKMLFSIKQLI